MEVENSEGKEGSRVLAEFFEDVGLGYFCLDAGTGQFIQACQRTAELLGFATSASMLAADHRLQDYLAQPRPWPSLESALLERHPLILQLSEGNKVVISVRSRRRDELLEGCWEILFDSSDCARSTHTMTTSLLKALPLAISITDEQGAVVGFNEQALQLFQASKETFAAGHAEGPHPLRNEQGIPVPDPDFPSMRALREGRPLNGEICSVQRADGYRQWLRIDAVPLEIQGLGLCVSSLDLTECQEHRARFRTMFEESRAVQLIIEPSSGRILRANRAAADFYGYSVDEMQGRPIAGINCGSAELVQSNLDQAVEREMRFLFKHKLASGELRDVEVFTSPSRYQGREALTSIIIDVTERELARKALIESERRFNEITSSIRDSLYILDSDERYVAVYGPWLENYGYSRERIVGKTLRQLVGEERAAPHCEAQQRALKGEHVLYHSYFQTPIGPINLEISLNPIFDSDGSVSGIVGIGRDIEELTRVREDLQERENRYRAMIDGTADALYLVDADFKLIDVNRTACDMTGFSRAELCAMKVYHLDVLESETSVHCKFSTIQPGAKVTVRSKHRHKDGREIPIEASIRCFSWRETHLYVAVVRDIRERLKAEEERLEVQRSLIEIQKNESLAILAGGVAHDFNNILAGVLGNAELALLDLDEGTEIYEMLSEIYSSAIRATELGKQMLAYSGKGRFSLDVVDPNAIIKGLDKTLLAMTRHQNPICFDLDEEIPHIHVDATQLRQVIQNLVVNANEAVSDAGGKVTIKTELYHYTKQCPWRGDHKELEPKTYVRIAVQDSGEGIPKAYQDRIFEPFFSTKFAGRGLGLAASQGIMAGHKGAILFHSEEGKGTTFNLLFPASAELAKPAKAALEASVDATRKKHAHVLLVDDEELVLNVTTKMLVYLGHSVDIARNGADAIQYLMAKAESVDLVILDMMMPVMGGLRALDIIRERWPTLPVLMCSGYNEQEAINAFRDKESRDFLQKPFQLDILDEKLKRLLGT